MLNKIYRKTADFRSEGSIALKMRLERINLFKELISSMNLPLNILDIGGTSTFWEIMGLAGENNFQVTILNLYEEKAKHDNLKCVIGDGRDLKNFEDNEFDVVFSNSVIEHLGNLHDQKLMAEEIQRVGKNYFVQTPNFYSPIEPHFFFPFFPLLPNKFKIFLLNNFNLGYFKKTNNEEKSKEIIQSIRLLKEEEVKDLFQGCHIKLENYLGFTISFIIYKFENKMS